MKKEALYDSIKRQEQNENLTKSVLDFTEGIGIIKTYNLLAKKFKELNNNFQKSCELTFTFKRTIPYGSDNLIFSID